MLRAAGEFDSDIPIAATYIRKVEGRLPRGIGVERLREAPAEWSKQFEALGLNPNRS
jgi:hypothetical protein